MRGLRSGLSGHVRRYPTRSRRAILLGTCNGTNKEFYLPTPAIANTLRIFKRASAGTVTEELSWLPDNVFDLAAGIIPTASHFQSTSYGFGSGPAAHSSDGSDSTFWSPGTSFPCSLYWDFGTQKIVSYASVAFNSTGGFSGTLTWRLSISDDGTNWQALADLDGGTTSLQEYVSPLHRITRRGARYWKYDALTRTSGIELSVSKVGMYTTIGYASMVTLKTAPASGDTVYVQYAEKPL